MKPILAILTALLAPWTALHAAEPAQAASTSVHDPKTAEELRVRDGLPNVFAIGFSDIPQGSGIEVEVIIDHAQVPIAIKRPQTESQRRYARFFYLPEQPPGEHTAILSVKQLPEDMSFYAGQILVIGTMLP